MHDMHEIKNRTHQPRQMVALNNSLIWITGILRENGYECRFM